MLFIPTHNGQQLSSKSSMNSQENPYECTVALCTFKISLFINNYIIMMLYNTLKDIIRVTC